MKLWIAAAEDEELRERLVPVEKRIYASVSELSAEVAGELGAEPGLRPPPRGGDEHRRRARPGARVRPLGPREPRQPVGLPPRGAGADARRLTSAPGARRTCGSRSESRPAWRRAWPVGAFQGSRRSQQHQNDARRRAEGRIAPVKAARGRGGHWPGPWNEWNGAGPVAAEYDMTLIQSRGLGRDSPTRRRGLALRHRRSRGQDGGHQNHHRRPAQHRLAHLVLLPIGWDASVPGGA